MTTAFQDMMDNLDSFRIELKGFDHGGIKHQWTYTHTDGKQYCNTILSGVMPKAEVSVASGLSRMLSDAIMNFSLTMAHVYGLETGLDQMRRYQETGAAHVVPSEEEQLRLETRRRYGI